MGYTKTFKELRAIYNPEDKETLMPDLKTRITNLQFQSDFSSINFSNTNDQLISENNSFSYPVFTPANNKSNKVILLLHGLNERSWVKYLVWGYRLSIYTGSYVILFPISFHINRSPGSWRDPRAMIDLMKERKFSYGEIEMSSFANAALSERLTEDPLRFFNSGYQTASDITKLISGIKKGENHVIPKGSSINIFAYSIGAFLAEIILMGNPENLFSDSKLFIFCGGSVFSNMRGSSKMIMDSVAFDKVYNYYMNDFEKDIIGKSPFSDILKSSQIGLAFRAMIDFSRLKNFRENILKKLSGQIQTITLKKDRVIPMEGVVKTLDKLNSGLRKVTKVWDFPYSYTHENPFPVFDSPLSFQVDQSFDRVFSEACTFLA
jgi:hypothetical protein